MSFANVACEAKVVPVSFALAAIVFSIVFRAVVGIVCDRAHFIANPLIR